MKQILIVFLMVMTCVEVQAQSTTEGNETQTTLIFVRHAEKADDGTEDPPLTTEGEERAEKLAKMLLKTYDVSNIYSTDFKRTRETARPLADSLGVITKIYGFDNIPELLSSIIEENEGAAALVVGHSNSTPTLVNSLLNTEKYEKLPEDEYGTYFIVTVHLNGTMTDQKVRY